MVKKVEVDVFQGFKNSILRNLFSLTEGRSYNFEAPLWVLT